MILVHIRKKHAPESAEEKAKAGKRLLLKPLYHFLKHLGYLLFARNYSPGNDKNCIRSLDMTIYYTSQ
jgi:hypothetical protein